MIIDLFSALFGGLVTAGGVYTGAAVARLLSPRHATPKQTAAPRARSRRATPPAADTTWDRFATPATKKLGDDVVAALTTSGFSKSQAALAVAACSGSERSKIESWIRAALRRVTAQPEAVNA